MDQQPVVGPDLGRSLNPGFLLKPVKQGFNRLSDPADGRREPLIEGVQVGLSLGLFHRGPQRQVLLSLAELPEQLIDIGFVPVQLTPVQLRRNLPKRRQIMLTGRSQPDLLREGQRPRPPPP